MKKLWRIAFLLPLLAWYYPMQYLMGISYVMVPFLIYVLFKERKKKIALRKQIESDFEHFSQSKYEEISGNDFMTTMQDNGLLGEYNLFRALEELGEEHILTNLYIPKKRNQTSEIDLVVINRKGIHVFESKNYSGKIYGNDTRDKWSQVTKRRKKYTFQNPVKQNMGHILALQDFIPSLDSKWFSSVIVFGSECQLDKVSVDLPNVIVTQLNELTHTFGATMYKSKDVLTDEQVKQIYQHCKTVSLASPEVKAKHIEDAKKAKKRFNWMIRRTHYSTQMKRNTYSERQYYQKKYYGKKRK